MKPRVLLVEDDPIAQDLATAILLSAGFETDVAPDGFVAVQLVRNNPYSIALVDYHLPEMDGYALAKLMRDAANDEGRPIKLVGITADRDGLAARRGADSLFEMIIVKPFLPQKLIDLVSNATAETRQLGQMSSDISLGEENMLADRARGAAVEFWRARGLACRPRAFVFPAPSPRQAENLSTCFDLVSEAAAELFILLHKGASEQLAKIRAQRDGDHLPIVSIERSAFSGCDLHFEIEDPQSWSDLAEFLARLRRSA
ncbi:response regulator [Tardiphaga sp. vice154]|uniref:response regulator n=1 Tax=Tardiphaga sp. vice154 TaxID=2592814 RepID=UPI0011627325|nr:response regulator [Tardiphaga sp. vice154]QDM20797.1 response regulator [Tardiphaga sp. vice154]